ncbi:PilZ domain-containing protein [Alteromonas flava]|uniref:PilZ domain-containing protein n=1 Tax=Alteromonas flava TaxID=2048003 RepID=UPI000C286B74|nr:PilZ domain-containing protein [Alteromonas flava]
MSNPAGRKQPQNSDEALVIKQYTALIDKLIPLQQENRLLEGLNKFSGRLNSRVRNIIKNEVIRLTSLTDVSADNSEFANFPVMKFKHFGIPMRLDKVGKDILEQETAKYLDRYTVGVFESVMNSEHYQAKVREDQLAKIADSFSTESQSFEDIDFADDLAIRPNFTVSCPEFDKGKHCPLASLSFTEMVVETKRTPQIDTEESILAFTFPQVAGFTPKAIKLNFELIESHFNKQLSVFESRFRLLEPVPAKLRQRLHSYIKGAVHQFPLQFDLEIERAMQDLERDRILAHSPWLPVFIRTSKDVYSMAYHLVTPVNSEYNGDFDVAKDLPGETILQRLIKELQRFEETFLLKGRFNTKSGAVVVFVTHRELAAHNMIKQFIEQGEQIEDFKILQCRLNPIEDEHKQQAFAIHDLIAHDYPELTQISHVLYCKDVTEWIGELEVAQPEPFKPFPKSIINQDRPSHCDIVMESAADRRAQPRYAMNEAATIKLGFFSQLKATLDDLSENGLKLTLLQPENVEIGDEVKVSVSDLQLTNQKYRVVVFEPETGVLRLCLDEQTVKQEGGRLQRLFSNNAEYFSQRNLAVIQLHTHRFLWELCIRNMPCASVLITNNRFAIDRLKTVYHKQNCYDLKPFNAAMNKVPLHGFFADKESPTPRSELLEKMLKTNLRDVHVVHAIKIKDKQIIYIDLGDFLFGKVRHQLCRFVAEKLAQACVTHISAIRCPTAQTPLTAKRLAQLSKINIEMYEKLIAMQNGYTHVLYLTNVSAFHNVLLRFGINPKKAAADTPSTEVAKKSD